MQLSGKPWHACSPSEALDALHSRSTGLNEDDASRRLSVHGPNVIRRSAGPSVALLLGAQFKGVVVLLLVAAAILSLLLRDYADTLTIGIVVALNAGIGFVTELRAR